MRFSPAPTDSAEAVELLDEYFGARAAGFVGGEYRTVHPDPAAFTPPAGVFLLVHGDGGELAGCGGIRRIGDTEAGALRYEVKHLYLRETARGRGRGRALLAELERRAAEFGASEVVLDTNRSLTAAGGLYRSSGYESIEPYNDNPNATDWYRKDLAG
ncbi:GNAT family N-acetyltransferase [Amnibacterium flavum]|uniref:N-acetylglutamate synthase n=1 Tax=Amnibacterium flavum TaxID=2173173 RepID=A0A2V1HRE4_9MICO|nr:GNAT family N-acetyltransferase [Amnibacterium flavum]PVZ93540.1 N-acetylglutamate synthase [Amnibacterium flavum]